MPTFDLYERLIGRFVAWAETMPDIRAAVIIGSRARTTRPADEWSDLDLIFMTARPEFYIRTCAWLDQFGPYWMTFVEGTATGEGHERRVLFEGALDVDFIPVPAAAFTSPATLPLDIRDIIRRGVRVVLDKDGVVSQSLSLVNDDPGPCEPLPDEAAFLNVVNDFWFHAVWSAKKLRRGELWTANGCINNYMKWQGLLPVIRWHARATHGADYDTWVRGRFLEQWADPRVVTALPLIFGRCEADDLWRALFETMNLFRGLAAETAEKLGFSYPAQAEAQLTNWVKTCFEERNHHE